MTHTINLRDYSAPPRPIAEIQHELSMVLKLARAAGASDVARLASIQLELAEHIAMIERRLSG